MNDIQWDNLANCPTHAIANRTRRQCPNMADGTQNETMVFPQWTRSGIGNWAFTLLIVPLFWWMMFVVIGEMTFIIWLLAMALYIPLLLFVGGKIKHGNPAVPTHTEKLRRLVVWLGRIELGMFLFALYLFAYMIILYSDDLSAR